MWADPLVRGDPQVAWPRSPVILTLWPLRLMRTWNKGLAGAFLLSLSFLVAQDPTSFMTADVARVAATWRAGVKDAGIQWATAP